MVYIFNELNILQDKHYFFLRKYVAQDRLVKCDNYISITDRKRCIIAYLLLRYGLLNEYSIREMPEIEIRNKGKPFIKNISNIHFSITHSKNAIACGIHFNPIGVDIEERIDNSKKLSKVVLSNQEIEIFQTVTDPDDFFTRIWTLKESYIKNSNFGSLMCFRKLDFSLCKDDTFIHYDLLFQIKKFYNYYLSVCTDMRLENRIVLLSDLLKIGINIW